MCNHFLKQPKNQRVPFSRASTWWKAKKAISILQLQSTPAVNFKSSIAHSTHPPTVITCGLHANKRKMQAMKSGRLTRLISAALSLALMWIICCCCCCNGGVQSLPLLVYFRGPPYESNTNYNDNVAHPPLPPPSSYQRVPPILFPQARLLGDYDTPQFMVGVLELGLW